MIYNSNQLETNPNSKGKAIASLILGIISVIPAAIIGMEFREIIKIPGVMVTISFLAISLTGTFWIAIAGLILGAIGVKSTKKKFAILGIILSIIGFGASVYTYLFFLRIGAG
ncbi:MAG: hypothetical protein ACE5WD_13650 [Candidatus Aminicenantia bacterium]